MIYYGSLLTFRPAHKNNQDLWLKRKKKEEKEEEEEVDNQ